MKSLKSKLMAAGVMVMISAVMLTSASFAWFTVSTAPEISQVKVQMTATKNMEIAKATDKTTAPSEVTSDDHSAETKWGGKVSTFDNATIDFPATVPTATDAPTAVKDKVSTVQYDATGRTNGLIAASAPSDFEDVASDGTKDGFGYYTAEPFGSNNGTKKVAAVYGVWLRSNVNTTNAKLTIDTSSMAVKRGETTVTDKRVTNSVTVGAIVPDTYTGTTVTTTKTIANNGTFELKANTPVLVQVIVYMEGEHSGSGDDEKGLIAADVASAMSIEGIKVSFSSTDVTNS